MNLTKCTLCAIITAVLGIILVFLGVFVQFWLYPYGLEVIVHKETILEPGTEAYNNFVVPLAPVYMKFWVFDVLNVDEIKVGGKPKVVERGPYVYEEIRVKENIVDLIDTINFDQLVHYHYREQETLDAGCDNGRGSPCSPDDKFTVLNSALVSAVYVVDYYVEFQDGNPDLADALLTALNALITGQDYADDLFNTVGVDDLLFGGYAPGTVRAIYDILDRFNLTESVELPIMLQDGELALFNGRNGSKQSYTIASGRYDKYHYAHILKYQGSEKLPESWWPTPVGPTPSATDSGVEGICRDIIGTDGLAYHQFVKREERLWLFNSDLCRSIWLDYSEDVETRGIKLLRFRPPPDVFDMRNKYNYCYCNEFMKCSTEVEDKDEYNPTNCFPLYCTQGVLKNTGCFGGVPVLMSAPHFYQAYPDYVQQIDGMNPSRELHDTTVDIEENTGLSMSIHKRIQINVPLSPTDKIDVLKSVRGNLFPIIWLDEGGDVDAATEAIFDDMYTKPVTFVAVLTWGVLMGLGGVIFLIGCCYVICRGRLKEYEEELKYITPVRLISSASVESLDKKKS